MLLPAKPLRQQLWNKLLNLHQKPYIHKKALKKSDKRIIFRLPKKPILGLKIIKTKLKQDHKIPLLETKHL